MSREDILSFLLTHKDELYQKYSVTRIGLFGSYAKGTATPESDVDVIVQLDKPNLLTLSAIRQELQESFKTPVDVIRLRDTMNPFLKQQIAQEAIYV
jgi:predicted nucleotidyltransferase